MRKRFEQEILVKAHERAVQFAATFLANTKSNDNSIRLVTEKPETNLVDFESTSAVSLSLNSKSIAQHAGGPDDGPSTLHSRSDARNWRT